MMEAGLVRAHTGARSLSSERVTHYSAGSTFMAISPEENFANLRSINLTACQLIPAGAPNA